MNEHGQDNDDTASPPTLKGYVTELGVSVLLWLTTAVCLFFFAVVPTLRDSSPKPTDLPFNRSLWLNPNDFGRDAPRIRMATAVRARLRSGHTRRSVIRLLGEPDEHPAPHVFSYRLGSHGFSDPVDLLIQFDDTGGLTSAVVCR